MSFWVKYNQIFRRCDGPIVYLELDCLKNNEDIEDEICDAIQDYYRGDYIGIAWEFVPYPPVEYIDQMINSQKNIIVKASDRVEELLELKDKITNGDPMV